MQLKGKNLVHCFSSSSHLAFFLDQILSFPRTPLFTWQPKLFQIVPNLLLLFLDQVSTFQSSVCYMSPNFDTFWELVCQGRWRYGWLSGCKAWHKQLVATTHNPLLSCLRHTCANRVSIIEADFGLSTQPMACQLCRVFFKLLCPWKLFWAKSGLVMSSKCHIT